MFNWYNMGANAPSFIDEANDRRRAVNVGDDYATRKQRSEAVAANLYRQGTIRAWRTAPATIVAWRA